MTTKYSIVSYISEAKHTAIKSQQTYAVVSTSIRRRTDVL